MPLLILLFLCPLPSLLCSFPAQADTTGVQAQITSLQGQIADLNNNQIAPLEAEIANLRAGMTEARTFMNEFTKRNDWLLTENAAHRRRLKEYQGKELQLGMSYIDFFNAKEAWANSNDPETKRAQILIMFRYLFGTSREPGQWELNPNTQKDFVDMADLIVRKKAVARLGEALLLLGELTTQLVDSILGVPQTMKEAVFQTIVYTVDTTIKLLPNDVVAALNNTCLRYVPYLELQKQRAELLASQLNEIRNREEYGGEPGRVEALEKVRALIVYEQDVLAELEPELTAYLARRAAVEANFATVQQEINDKQAQLDALKETRRTLTQSLIDKQFELSQLQEQEAISQNGGPTNYVTALSIAAKDPNTPTSNCYTVATDARSSALLNLPRYAVLSAGASYATEKAEECTYSVANPDDPSHPFVHHESYHSKQTFSAAATNPAWRKVNPTGDVTISGNRAYGTAVGNVPLQAALFPSLASESWGTYQNCSQDYLPVGGGEKLSGTWTLGVKKVDDALFLPIYYYSKTYSQGLTGTAQFDAMKTAADTYGRGIDLFVDGAVNKWGSVALYYTILNADGSRSSSSMTPQMKPEGDLAAFEINNQMKALGNGTALVKALLFDKDGLPVPAGAVNDLTVTGNTVSAKVSTNGATDLTPLENATLVIDEAAQFAVTVGGPANMGNYQVNWRYFYYKTTGYPTGWQPFTRHNGVTTTQFSGAAGNWVSQNPVTLNDPTDYNQKVKVEYDILRKYDGVVVYTGKFENLRSIVKGKRFFLANATTHAEYAGTDYFLIRGINSWTLPISSMNLELRLDLGDGRSILVPLADSTEPVTDTIKNLLFGTTDASNQGIGNTTLYTNYLNLYLSSLDISGSVDLGIAELREADQDSLLNDLGIVVERTANTVMTSADVNLWRVNYRETDSGPFYVLKACSATPLQNFHVRWTFFDESTTETPFTAVGLLQESQTAMAQSLKKVELLNPQGNVATQLCFLGACGGTSYRVPVDVGMYYRLTSEYRYDEAAQGYKGQLTRLVKSDLGRTNVQFELDFQFPVGFPQLRLRTVNDVNGALLPYVANFAVADRVVTFDVTKPDAGAYTLLSVLNPPAFGALSLAGNAVTYTPGSGFSKTDRFTVRIDGRRCDIEPDIVSYDLEGEVDLSGPHPLVRFRLIFTPVYQYGEYDLGFVLEDTSGQTLTSLSVTQAPAAGLSVQVVSGVVDIKKGTLPANSRDLFKLGLETAGGASGGTVPLSGVSGEATVNLWYYTAYPEFTVYRNRDFHIPPELVLHRFFRVFANEIQQVKLYSWANGSVMFNGQPHNYDQAIAAADLDKLVFRPTQNFTGPTKFLFFASDGTTWTGWGDVVAIGGRIVEAAGLAELVRLLQILSGLPLLPPDASLMSDIDGDGRMGLPEALRLLQEISGLRN
jgi:hypothetical protein